MNAKDVALFEKVESQVRALHGEMGVLAKSKPDSPISKFKVGLINEKLREANKLLPVEFRPFAEFEVFDETELPTNSDALIMLSQYLECLGRWRSVNQVTDPSKGYGVVWKIDDGEKTEEPPSLRPAKGRMRR